MDAGRMLAGWRSRRRLTQLELSSRSGVSAKHLSFIETGRAKPSRNMIFALAKCLEISPVARDRLLIAAGFAPAGPARSTEAWDLAVVEPALAMLLKSVEPAGAVAYGAGRELLMANETYVAWVNPVLTSVVWPLTFSATGPNLLDLLFASDGYRLILRNWDAVAAGVFARAQRELAAGGNDALRATLDGIEARGLVPGSFHQILGEASLGVLVELICGDDTVTLSSTIASFGPGFGLSGPAIHVEIFHPLTEHDSALLSERVRLAKCVAPSDQAVSNR